MSLTLQGELMPAITGQEVSKWLHHCISLDEWLALGDVSLHW